MPKACKKLQASIARLKNSRCNPAPYANSPHASCRSQQLKPTSALHRSTILTAFSGAPARVSAGLSASMAKPQRLAAQ